MRGTPHNTGTVMRSLLDHGARPVGELDQCHAVAIDARAPKFDGGIASRIDGVPFGIVLNRDAERFYDEGEEVKRLQGDMSFTLKTSTKELDEIIEEILGSKF